MEVAWHNDGKWGSKVTLSGFKMCLHFFLVITPGLCERHLLFIAPDLHLILYLLCAREADVSEPHQLALLPSGTSWNWPLKATTRDSFRAAREGPFPIGLSKVDSACLWKAI